MPKEITIDDYRRQLNELAPPYDSDDWVIGGEHRYWAFEGKYGDAIKRYDPIAFNVGLSEHRRERQTT